MKKSKITRTFENCLVTRVIDGDTYECLMDLGFFTHRNITVRLTRVNTPEVRGAEKIEGKKVKAYLQELIENKRFTIFCYGKGKYGRWICEFILKDGTPLSDHLLQKKMAKIVSY